MLSSLDDVIKRMTDTDKKHGIESGTEKNNSSNHRHLYRDFFSYHLISRVCSSNRDT